MPDSIESFWYVQRYSKRFTEIPNCRGPSIREKRKKITSRAFLSETILTIRDKIRGFKMFPILPFKIDSKTLERIEVKAIGR